MTKISTLLLSVFLSLPAFAHENYEPSVRLDFAPATVELRESDVDALIRQSHELIEGDESGGFLKRWRGAFNFKARFVDGLRWSASVNDSTYRNLAVDSLFLFGLSHGTEMISGPVLLGIGYAENWPNWVMSAIAGGGTLISVPGLDPLCMITFAFYAKSARFRGGIGWLRVATLKSLGRFADATGIKTLVARTFAKPDLKNYLENIEGLKSISVAENGIVDFQYELRNSRQESALVLGLHFENGVSYLEELVVDRAALKSITATDLKAFTRQFGWNARDFIAHAAREPLRKPYVLDVNETTETLQYRLAPHAIAVYAKRASPCEDRLRVPLRDVSEN